MKTTLLALTALTALFAADAAAQCQSGSASFRQSRTSSVRFGGGGLGFGSSFSSSRSISRFGTTGGVQFATTQPVVVAPTVVQPVVVQRPFFGQQLAGRPVVVQRPFFGQQVVTQPVVAAPVVQTPFVAGRGRNARTVTTTKVKPNGAVVTKTKVGSKKRRAGRRRR